MIDKILNQLKLRYLSYTSKTSGAEETDEARITSGLNWFRQSLMKGGGSSAKYSLLYDTFFPAYPETTGYWLNTLFFIRQHFPHIYTSVFGQRVVETELKDWLLSIQRLDGTFPGSFGDYFNQPPRVFNNGQIILGLLKYYEHYKDEQVMNAIIMSADWLLRVQAKDGGWKQFTIHQLSSNTRTAWALMLLSKVTGERKYHDAAVKNIDFAISLQLPNGYFLQNGFDASGVPYTHSIAYAIKGMLEAAALTGNEKWLQSTERAFAPLIPLIKKDGYLFGQIDEDFNSTSNYCCLTGNCQLSVSGFKLFSLTGKQEYKQAANQLINYVKEKQIKSDVPSLSGGISGSWPISGGYCPYEIPNWSVKFFIDALVFQHLSKQKDFGS